MFRILLVQVPWSARKTPIVPLPLLVLGACLRTLRAEGMPFEHSVVDLDLALKRGEFEDSETFYGRAAERLARDRPDACFFTTHGPNESIVVQVAKRLKAIVPRCLVIIGGVTATLHGRDFVESFPWVDGVVKGEGEPVLRELVGACLSGGDLSSVPAVICRKDGRVIENRQIHPGREDGFVFPDYSLVDLGLYARLSSENAYAFPGFTPVECGRGCANACRFCGPAAVWKRRVRHRDLSEIIAEMRLVARHGMQFVFFTQDNLDELFLRRLSRALVEARVGIPWGCYARLYDLSEDTAHLMARAGCRHVFAGFETSAPDLHAFIGKSIDRRASLAKVACFGSLGITIFGSFLAAIPGETREQFEDTLEFALECSVGIPLAELLACVGEVPIHHLPAGTVHSSFVNPIACSPGTELHAAYASDLRLAEASTNDDACGSYLLGMNEFVREHWKVTSNSFITALTEKEFHFAYPVIRVFNYSVAHPFRLAKLMTRTRLGVLDLMHELASRMHRRFIYTSTASAFDRKLDEVTRQLTAVTGSD